MKEFHFSCGDSSKGPVGFCASITAETAEEALKILKAQLPEELMVVEDNLPGDKDYIQVYFNADAITLADNDYEEEPGGDDDEEDDDDDEEEDEASSDSGK